MKFLKGLLFFIFMSLAGSMNAQDIHFTQFYLSPLTTNPAYTGAFEGTFRVGGIIRDQWGSVLTQNSFRTPSFYVDAPLIMVGKRSWLGVGAMFYTDKAGTLSLGTNQFAGSAAIHMALDKKSQNMLTIGVQAGSIRRSINTTDAISDASIRFGADPLLGLGQSNDGQFNSSSFDVNAGILLKSRINEKMRLEIGASLKHILTPDLHLNEGVSVAIDPDSTVVGTGVSADGRDAWDVPGNFLLHGQFFVDVTDKWQIKPAFLFQSLSGANEIMIQGLVGYHLNEKKDMTLNFGVGYRLRDATKFIVGMDYKQFRAGFAYDLTISDLRDASSSANGLELGVSYIAKIFKKPNVKPVIFCPRF